MTVLLWQDFAPGCDDTYSDIATHVPDIKVGRPSVHCQNTHSLLLIVDTVNVHQKLASRLQT